MELRDKNQNLHVLKTSTIWHSDIQALPVTSLMNKDVINFSITWKEKDNWYLEVVGKENNLGFSGARKDFSMCWSDVYLEVWG